MKRLNERQKKELDLARNSHFLTVKQLSRLLDVSEMTIRRDVSFLAQNGYISKVYGGIVAVKPREENNYIVSEEMKKNKELKQKIAQKAVTLIHSNDVIFFDSGTTVQLLAEALPTDFVCTAISSSFNTLNVLAKITNSTIITPGGVLAQKPKVFYDQDSIKAIKRYRAHIAFIGATGYELEMGPTCAYIEDSPLKRAIMESSKKKVLLIDSSKFGVVSACSFAKIGDFTTVITDSGIPAEYIEQIQTNKTELIIV
ncbi:DeoR/GlpR transcriptional regulator [Treponema sp. OMZ 840]|uniref:DeoR/GlpR family DNA-binding transcription regulator n=1 Tax=Treponema sp. OMZ 840 TaxID=244313 RepID=UPI003D8FDB09